MNIVSILITIAGIIAILALYIISQLSQQKRPKDQVIIIPKIHDEKGRIMSSVLDDIPATDGSTPVIIEPEPAEKTPSQPISERQIVLFIATTDPIGIDGNKIPAVLEKHNLQFGDLDIFHYMMNIKGKPSSLFRIANGVKPWTLVPQTLRGTHTPGLSIIMQLPSPFNDYEVMELFITHASGIANDLGAQLKNAQQKNFSEEDKKALLASVA